MITGQAIPAAVTPCGGIRKHYWARSSHWYGDMNALTIDAGGLKALIRHFKKRDTDLERTDDE